MSAHVIRLTIVALLAAFYYAICVALAAPSIVTIIVVVYAVLAGILTMVLATLAGGGEPDATRAAARRSPRRDRQGHEDADSHGRSKRRVA
jgi:hypothetical protein